MSKGKQGNRPSIPTPEEIAKLAKEIREENLEAKKRPHNDDDDTTPWTPKVYKFPFNN